MATISDRALIASVKHAPLPARGPTLLSSGHSYLALLLAEYESLMGDLTARNPRAVEIAEAVKARLASGDGTWDDVHNLEIALLELQPFEELTRRAWSLRADYKTVIGDCLFNEYLHSLPSGINKHERLLRADLRRVLAELHRYRTLQRAENEARKANLTRALLGFVGVLLLLLAIPALVILLDSVSAKFSITTLSLFSPLRSRTGWLMPLAAFFGSVGGLVSVMQRIKVAQSADVKSLELLPSWPMALAPIVGALGGLLGCLLFESGLLKGSLFPDLNLTAQPDLANPEFFKLMVWAFIAGFSEKLVPDTLDWLASNAVADKNKTLSSTSVSDVDMGFGKPRRNSRTKRPPFRRETPENGPSTERPLH